jgi:DNA-binding NtrC family response regulator
LWAEASSIYREEEAQVAHKILVVEDEFSSRDSLCKFLGRESYIIREASNGAEALEKIAGENFDLVVTDFVMPHIDGLRLVELVHAKWPQLPVILITGYLSANAGQIILEGMAAEIITKPIKLDELLKAVKRILLAKANM